MKKDLVTYLTGGGKKSSTGGVAQAITAYLGQRWPEGEVPYYIAPALRTYTLSTMSTFTDRSGVERNVYQSKKRDRRRYVI